MNSSGSIQSSGWFSETRSRVGYYLTCTPVLLRHALRDADAAIYLDADLLLFSSPAPALEAFANGSIYIHEHRQGHPDGYRTAGHLQRRPRGSTQQSAGAGVRGLVAPAVS